MNRHSRLLGGVSLAALSLFAASAADAQQSLPTIEVGGVRAAVRRGPVARPVGGPARVTAATSTPGPADTAPPGFSPQAGAARLSRSHRTDVYDCPGQGFREHTDGLDSGDAAI